MQSDVSRVYIKKAFTFAHFPYSYCHTIRKYSYHLTPCRCSHFCDNLFIYFFLFLNNTFILDYESVDKRRNSTERLGGKGRRQWTYLFRRSYSTNNAMGATNVSYFIQFQSQKCVIAVLFNFFFFWSKP